jgi:hypothetical protein
MTSSFLVILGLPGQKQPSTSGRKSGTFGDNSMSNFIFPPRNTLHAKAEG